MAKFNIYILASHRSRVMKIQTHFFKRMKNKDKIKVYIMTTGHECYGWDCEPIYKECCAELCAAGIETEITVTTGGDNYMQKIEFAQTQKCEYAISMDEDLWFNENVLDFMIDKADEVLSKPENLVLTPILSNGIPTCDMFVEDFMTPEQQAEVNSMIVKTEIPDMWGANYQKLNRATTRAGGIWSPDLYYSLVKDIRHHYKGIHPVRINFELNKRINDIILADWDKFVNVPYEKLYAQETKHPYLCNSVFVIKADRWRGIIADKSLFRDPFDEVPLNLYREQNNLNWVFVRHGYCMHMIYNTVSQFGYENDLTTQCVDLIES